MRSRLSSGWPVLALSVILLLVIGVFLRLSLQANDGHFVYAQDDPYIHLTIARTLAEHGVWGISPDAFAAASSSPLWTVLLAACQAVGWRSDWPPFVLNVVAAVGLVVLIERELRAHLRPWPRFWGVLALAAVIPLPTLVFIGMEHTLQILVLCWLACNAARRLTTDASGGPWYAGGVAAAAATGLRYESGFVILPLAALFVARRRASNAFVLLAGMVTPVAAFAAYSLAHGGLPVPNPILLKSGAERFGSASNLLAVVGDWVNLLSAFQYPAVAALAIGACVIALLGDGQRERSWTVRTVLTAVFVVAALLHLCLVRLSSFYRYEAYLIALGGLAVIASASEGGVRAFFRARRRDPVTRWAAVVCAVLLSAPMAKRGAEALLTLSRATHEIYLQQYQMALFLREYYPGTPVAVNDIGLVGWLAPVRVVDLLGLASADVSDARRHGANDAAFYERLLTRHDVAVACVYEKYFPRPGIIPATWRRVATWSIGYHLAVGDDVVTFFARSEDDARRLAAALHSYAPRLPEGVMYVAEARAQEE